jgi:hypothetical protein
MTKVLEQQARYTRVIISHRLHLIPLALFFTILPSLPAAAQPTVRVTVDGASIWSAPVMPAIVLATAKVGTTLEVLARVGSWYRVRLPNDRSRTGYIQIRLVEGKVDNVPTVGGPAVQPRGPARRGPPRQSFVSASGGYLPSILNFDTTSSFTLFVEEGTRKTSYKTRQTPLVDVSGGGEIQRNLFVAIAVSWAKGKVDADINEQVPHPFYFDQKRTLQGTAERLSREEFAGHFQVAKRAPLTRRISVLLGAGPSVFRLKQAFVTDVTYNETYPFDSLEFRSAAATEQQKTGWGGNVQLNIVTMLSRQAGIDVLMRYSRGFVRFPGSTGSTIRVPTGGIHVAIGLRGEF